MGEKTTTNRNQGRFRTVFAWTAVALAFVPSSRTLRAGDDAKPASTPSLPDGRLGLRTAPLLLLSRADVQKDLEMTAAQIASARRAIDDLRARALALKGKSGGEVLPARRAIDEAQARWLDRELSHDQHARLDQIELQWEGPSALVSRKAIAEAVEIDAKQRAIIVRAVGVRDRRRSQGQDIATVEADLAREVLQILTPEQQIRWRALMGRPFHPILANERGK